MVLLIPRRVLDESLSLYVLLQTEFEDEEHLRSHVSRLTINVDAHAYGTSPRPSAGQGASQESSLPRNEDIIWRGTVQTIEDPIIVLRGNDKECSNRQVVVVWRTTALLGKCRELLAVREIHEIDI